MNFQMKKKNNFIIYFIFIRNISIVFNCCSDCVLHRGWFQKLYVLLNQKVLSMYLLTIVEKNWNLRKWQSFQKKCRNLPCHCTLYKHIQNKQKKKLKNRMICLRVSSSSKFEKCSLEKNAFKDKMVEFIVVSPSFSSKRACYTLLRVHRPSFEPTNRLNSVYSP